MSWTRLFIQRIKITNTKIPSAEAECPSNVIPTQCLDSETAMPGLHPYASLDVTEGQCPKCSPFFLSQDVNVHSVPASVPCCLGSEQKWRNAWGRQFAQDCQYERKPGELARKQPSGDSGQIRADAGGWHKHPNFCTLIKTTPLNLSHTKRSEARE